MGAICNAVPQELLLEGQLCDAAIRVEDMEFQVHRIILCSCSSYFRDLFCSTQSSSELHIYSFPHVSPKIMSLILDYTYTHSIVVTQGNLLELWEAAEYFAIKGIVQACCDFLEQQLCFKNCIEIWKLADSHSCPELKQKACVCILNHFEEVAEETLNFLQLSMEQVAYFIEKDELNVKQESTVFEAIVYWVNYAPEERSSHMATLLSKVRLLLIPIEYLANIVSSSALVRNSPPCLTMIAEAINTLRESCMTRPLTHTRLPPAVLLALSGWENENPTSRIELYDVRAARWLTVSSGGEFPRVFQSCIFLNGFIYYIGGYDGVHHLSSVQKLNLASQTWQEVGSMHANRCFVSTVTLHGCIYAMGGCDSFGRLNTAERYEPDTNQWTLIAPMHEHRSDASAATLYSKVYICGGYQLNEPLRSAECYNPLTDQWTLFAPMEIGRSAAGAVAYKDHIYIVGGLNGNEAVSNVSVYDPLSNYWSTAASMINPRCKFGIAVLEDQLYVAGGFKNHVAISNVERYDSKTNTWYAVQDMETPMGCVSCCVVERDPHAAAYLS